MRISNLAKMISEKIINSEVIVYLRQPSMQNAQSSISAIIGVVQSIQKIDNKTVLVIYCNTGTFYIVPFESVNIIVGKLSEEETKSFFSDQQKSSIIAAGVSTKNIKKQVQQVSSDDLLNIIKQIGEQE